MKTFLTIFLIAFTSLSLLSQVSGAPIMAPNNPAPTTAEPTEPYEPIWSIEKSPHKGDIINPVPGLRWEGGDGFYLNDEPISRSTFHRLLRTEGHLNSHYNILTLAKVGGYTLLTSSLLFAGVAALSSIGNAFGGSPGPSSYTTSYTIAAVSSLGAGILVLSYARNRQRRIIDKYNQTKSADRLGFTSKDGLGLVWSF